MTRKARELTVVAGKRLSDWYCIEWAEHDNTSGFITLDKNSTSYWHSGRVGDADIEGSGEEMLMLAGAIELQHGGISFKRCAVETLPTGDVLLWSPRNSQQEATITATQAAQLAQAIRRIVVISEEKPT